MQESIFGHFAKQSAPKGRGPGRPESTSPGQLLRHLLPNAQCFQKDSRRNSNEKSSAKMQESIFGHFAKQSAPKGRGPGRPESTSPGQLLRHLLPNAQCFQKDSRRNSNEKSSAKMQESIFGHFAKQSAPKGRGPGRPESTSPGPTPKAPAP